MMSELFGIWRNEGMPHKPVLSLRIIILGGEVKDEMAQILVAQMLYLANADPKKDCRDRSFCYTPK